MSYFEASFRSYLHFYRHLQTLTELNLGESQFGSAGVSHLANALEKNTVSTSEQYSYQLYCYYLLVIAETLSAVSCVDEYWYRRSMLSIESFTK